MSPRSDARFAATDEELRAIEAAVDDCLDRGEGLLSQFSAGETEFLLRWRRRTHPKKAIPNAKRGRPRNELVRKLMTEWKLSKSTVYRVIAEVRRGAIRRQAVS
jgi:hypothetical protein